jgi:aminopeptidase I
LSERQTWNETLKKGGKYYITRNGTSLIAFTIGSSYKSGNGVAMIAGHVDALTARLKPVSTKTTKAGYVQLGVAPYAGALNSTWWDRDLGIGGRVLVKDGKTGKITTKLVNLGWPSMFLSLLPTYCHLIAVADVLLQQSPAYPPSHPILVSA